MRKITLLAVAFLFAVVAQAQEISFEESEGYVLDETIDGQNGWTAGDAAPILTISDEEASDGDYSLKIDVDNVGYIEEGFISGTSRDITEFLPESGAFEIGVDFHIPANDEGEIDLIISDATGQFTTARIAIFNGNVNIVETNILGEPVLAAASPIETGSFQNVKVVIDFEGDSMDYLINDESFYQSDITGAEEAGSIAFLTSGDSMYYVDNITIGGEMSVEDFEAVEFTHFTQNNQLFLSSDSQIGEVAIFNLLGQQVVSETLNDISGNIDLGSLNAGVYMTKVSVNGQTKSFKFIKN
ncbi:MAG TPA: T9SS type A sorting domain-containing protein [Flavobacteriaceae bacterium]|nr:T9SS type A sorting domain-containing protein [Flavobacteriaceae bacterium]